MNKHRDPIIEKVINKFSERSNVGYKKYGVTLHDDEPNLHKWLNHIPVSYTHLTLPTN